MRVWVTRAEPGARRTAQRLAALGHEAIVAPLLEVRTLDASLSLEGAAALAFTSANGVAAFVERESRRDLPVFAVGDATAEAAQAAGFEAVRSAGGDVLALADLIGDAAPDGVVLHVGALDPAGDLVGALGRRGVTARSAALYETVDQPPNAAALEPPPAAVLVHSPRAAWVLARHPPTWGIPAYCISPAAAAPLEGKFVSVHAAPYPDEAAMLKLLADATRQGS